MQQTIPLVSLCYFHFQCCFSFHPPQHVIVPYLSRRFRPPAPLVGKPTVLLPPSLWGGNKSRHRHFKGKGYLRRKHLGDGASSSIQLPEMNREWRSDEKMVREIGIKGGREEEEREKRWWNEVDCKGDLEEGGNGPDPAILTLFLERNWCWKRFATSPARKWDSGLAMMLCVLSSSWHHLDFSLGNATMKMIPGRGV